MKNPLDLLWLFLPLPPAMIAIWRFDYMNDNENIIIGLDSASDVTTASDCIGIGVPAFCPKCLSRTIEGQTEGDSDIITWHCISCGYNWK